MLDAVQAIPTEHLLTETTAHMLSSQQYDVEQKEICTLFFEFPPTETQKVY